MKIKAIISWLFALWTSYIFLGSLFYKFTDAKEPQHIFSTIGDWMHDTLGQTIGSLFANFGQYLIGSAELAASLILLSPIIFMAHREKLHCIGALLASVIMAGAVFFHLFTPLGWIPTWEENGIMQMDKGLANAALSILILGLIVAFLNKKT